MVRTMSHAVNECVCVCVCVCVWKTMFHGGDQQTLFYSGDNDAINLLKVTNGYEMKLSRFSYLSHTVRLFNAKPDEVCGKGEIYYQLAQT